MGDETYGNENDESLKTGLSSVWLKYEQLLL